MKKYLIILPILVFTLFLSMSVGVSANELNFLNESSTVNIIDKSKALVLNERYFSLTGVAETIADWDRYDYWIPVESGETYVVSGVVGGTTHIGVHTYDSDNVWISYLGDFDNTDTFTVPVGASYIHISAFDMFSSMNTLQIEKGLTSTAYVNYIEVVPTPGLPEFLVEIALIGVAVPGVIVSGITTITSAMLGSAILIFAVGLALVKKGFNLVPRVIHALRK